MIKLTVPDTDQYEELSSLLKTLQESGYALLYSVGDSRVFGKRGQLGGRRVYAKPGDVLYFSDGTLWVEIDDA